MLVGGVARGRGAAWGGKGIRSSASRTVGPHRPVAKTSGDDAGRLRTDARGALETGGRLTRLGASQSAGNGGGRLNVDGPNLEAPDGGNARDGTRGSGCSGHGRGRGPEAAIEPVHRSQLALLREHPGRYERTLKTRGRLPGGFITRDRDDAGRGPRSGRALPGGVPRGARGARGQPGGAFVLFIGSRPAGLLCEHHESTGVGRSSSQEGESAWR